MMVRGSLIAAAALVSFLPTVPSLAGAQSTEGLSIAEEGSILIDGKSFKIVPTRANSDVAHLARLKARPLGPATIVFRKGDKLYLAAAASGRANDARESDYARDPVQGAGPAGTQARAPDYSDHGWATGSEYRGHSVRVHVEYEPPKNPAHQELYDTLKERQVLETMQHMLAPFRFPVELTIKAMGCDGQANAWFNYDDPDESIPTVHMCYELLQEVVDTRPKMMAPGLAISPDDAVVGQFLFWTMHEVGHAVINMFKIPLLGREENAADHFAMYLMLQFGNDQAHRWVEGTAYTAGGVLKNIRENPQVQTRLEKFSSTHELPEQRLYNGLCLAFGADPDLFADLLETGLLPRARSRNCDREYETFDYAFKTEIMPHMDRQMAQAVFHAKWFPQAGSPEARGK